MLHDPVSVNGAAPALILPPGTRVGYRLTVTGTADVAFAYGPTGATRLTFARGDRVASGQTVVQTDERIVRHGVYAITGGGASTVSAEEYH